SVFEMDKRTRHSSDHITIYNDYGRRNTLLHFMKTSQEKLRFYSCPEATLATKPWIDYNKSVCAHHARPYAIKGG
ncbi:MAG: hypothetical protein RSC98_10350, partial [Clostridia bacterium]